MISNQLKKSILQAAYQGKLTNQLPDDGNAKKYLKMIFKEKKEIERLSKNILPEEVPFDIPENWCWTRLGDICEYIQRGKSPKYSLIKKYPVIAQKCNQISGFSIEKAQFIDPETVVKYSDERLLRDNDLMWNSTGIGTLGRIGIYETSKNPFGFAVADSHVTILRTAKHYVNSRYIYAYISGPHIQSIVENISSGSTKQKELSVKTIKNVLVPFPPIAEQNRIVEKLDELMIEIEKLRYEEKRLIDLQRSFPNRMKESILQYAIYGKLTKQFPEDGNADFLIKSILLNNKNSKVSIKNHELLEVDETFEIPINWRWARLGQLISLSDGQKINSSQFIKMDAAFLRGKTAGNLVSSGKFVERGSNVILVDGENSGEVFKLSCEGYMGSTFKQIKIVLLEMEPFLEYYLKMQQTFLRNNKIGAAIPHLNKKLFNNLLVPIPPLSEQKRIVELLDTLLPILNDLYN